MIFQHKFRVERGAEKIESQKFRIFTVNDILTLSGLMTQFSGSINGPFSNMAKPETNFRTKLFSNSLRKKRRVRICVHVRVRLEVRLGLRLKSDSPTWNQKKPKIFGKHGLAIWNTCPES